MDESHYGMSLGFGIALNFVGNKKLKIGYVYKDFEILSSIHAYALGFVF